MPREAIANQQITGRGSGPRLRNAIEGAATARETFFRGSPRKKIGGESASGRSAFAIVGRD